MNTEELYKKSQTAYLEKTGGTKVKRDMSPIISRLLTQQGFFDIRTGQFDEDRIYEAVVEGNIWMIRGMGEARVKEVCKWLDKRGYLKNR